jgi:hypothetical protein
VTDGPALNLQDITEDYVALTLDTQKHVGFQFSSKDLTLTIDQFSDRYVKPAVVALANQIDVSGTALYKKVWNAVGTVGTDPNTLLQVLQARQKLDENSTPVDSNRSVVINPAAETSLVDALKGLYQSSEKIAEQYEKGMIGIVGGFKWKMDQNVARHTTGPLGGTPQVDGSGTVTGATLSSKGWTAAAASRLKAGDVFTIDNVRAVNRQSKVSTGALMQFVVTADFSSDGSGNGGIAISPAIVTSGPTQNVDLAPVNNANINVMGAASTGTAANLAFHKDAFCLGMADLELPGGVDMAAAASDPDAGLALRLVRAYDITNDRFPCRIDALYGWVALYPELACRIMGA